MTVSQNQTVSKILEQLFTHSSAGHLRPVFISFCSELPVVVFDAFASHVFQSLIQYLPLMCAEGAETGVDGDMASKLKVVYCFSVFVVVFFVIY